MHHKHKLALAILLTLISIFSLAAFGRAPRAASLASVNAQATPLPGDRTRSFPETGKTVRGIFLDYWEANGALPQQGYPISDEMQEKSDLDGKTYTVQYFERAVFEYHPENQPPYNVLLSQLGTFAYKAGYPQGDTFAKLPSTAKRTPCSPTNDDEPGPYQPDPPVKNVVGKGHIVRGYVLDSSDCVPLAGAKVELWPEIEGVGHDPNDRAAVFTDKNGAYSYESRFPEHIHMRISASGYKTIFSNLYHPTPGTAEGTFDIVLVADPSCRTFTETGKPVCGSFLDYWNTHGGLPQQGFPISGEFTEKSALDGKTYTVQYFERAVFEKHPENQPPYDVLLSQLGTFAYRDKYTSQPGPTSTPTAGRTTTPGTYTGPTARAGHDLVYDDVRKVVLMLNAGDVAGDAEGTPTKLWSWDGATWKLLSTSGPPTRSLGGVAFDSQRGVLVIHGGVTNNFNYDDTWEWDGTKWTEKAVTPNPGFRHHFMMAYDAERKVIVAYGGNLQADETAQSQLTFPTDTWTWDGQTWKQAATTGLGTRYHYAMTYDSKLKSPIIFGGSARTSGRNDLWAWDGAKWAEITVAGAKPSARTSPAMAYDERTGKTILFGGRVGSSVLNDTWEWDGTKWTQLQPPGQIPPGRSHHAMTYDKTRQRIVMFGGIAAGADDNYLADTWEFDGTQWTKVSGP